MVCNFNTISRILFKIIFILIVVVAGLQQEESQSLIFHVICVDVRIVLVLFILLIIYLYALIPTKDKIIYKISSDGDNINGHSQFDHETPDVSPHVLISQVVRLLQINDVASVKDVEIILILFGSQGELED